MLITDSEAPLLSAFPSSPMGLDRAFKFQGPSVATGSLLAGTGQRDAPSHRRLSTGVRRVAFPRPRLPVH